MEILISKIFDIICNHQSKPMTGFQEDELWKWGGSCFQVFQLLMSQIKQILNTVSDLVLLDWGGLLTQD